MAVFYLDPRLPETDRFRVADLVICVANCSEALRRSSCQLAFFRTFHSEVEERHTEISPWTAVNTAQVKVCDPGPSISLLRKCNGPGGLPGRALPIKKYGLGFA